MFVTKCESCGELLHLREVKLDPRWRLLSTKDGDCYCPYCDTRLNNVVPNAVELARILTPKNILVFVLIVVIGLVAIATRSLSIVGPVLIILFGALLAKTSMHRDHRVIGWLLIIVFAALMFIKHGSN